MIQNKIKHFRDQEILRKKEAMKLEFNEEIFLKEYDLTRPVSTDKNKNFIKANKKKIRSRASNTF